MLRKVPYVPIDTELMREVFKYMNVEKGDSFIDIGSGDGKVVCWVAKEFPKVKIYKGVEVSSSLVFFSRIRRLLSKQKEKIDFEKKNALEFDYSKFNKVYMYLLSGFIEEIMFVLQEQLPRGAVVVSPIFAIPEDFKKFGELTVKKIEIRGKIKQLYIWKKK